MWEKLHKQGTGSLPSRENAVAVKHHTMWPSYGLVQEDKKMNVLPAPGLTGAVRDGFTSEGWFHVQLKPERKVEENLFMKREKPFNAGTREVKNYVIVETNQSIARDGHCRRLGTGHGWLPRQKASVTNSIYKTHTRYEKRMGTPAAAK